MRRHQTSESLVPAPSLKAVRPPPARNLDALLAQLPEERAVAANADPPQILKQYLELRANGFDDFGAQAAIARDRDLGEDELVEHLRLEASAVQAAGLQGLEPLREMWPPHSSPPRPWTPRGSAGAPSAAPPGH